MVNDAHENLVEEPQVGFGRVILSTDNPREGLRGPDRGVLRSECGHAAAQALQLVARRDRVGHKLVQKAARGAAIAEVSCLNT